LRDFGLVGRVAGEKLAALDERVDDDRPVMAIGSRAEKTGEVGRVFRPGRAKAVDDLALGVGAGKRQVAVEAVFGRNDGE
jgi:hypothetical protein